MSIDNTLHDEFLRAELAYRRDRLIGDFGRREVRRPPRVRRRRISGWMTR